MENKDNSFIRADEIASILDVSERYAYKVIRELNAELRGMGFHTITGRVSRAYFEEKMCYKKSNVNFISFS